jgi:hypothetical protein
MRRTSGSGWPRATSGGCSKRKSTKTRPNTLEGLFGRLLFSLKRAWLSHGRGWDRTSDLPRVKRALSR